MLPAVAAVGIVAYFAYAHHNHSFILQVSCRIVATSTGMLLVYKAANLEPPAEQCLHRMLCLPTPMGAGM